MFIISFIEEMFLCVINFIPLFSLKFDNIILFKYNRITDLEYRFRYIYNDNVWR